MSDRILAHLQALVGERHPFTAPAGLRHAERYLTDQFRTLGWNVTVHEFQALGGTYRNLIATSPQDLLPLTPHASRLAHPAPLIIAAHYDTVPGSPGADDNASGLAVLLEVARRLRDVALARPVQVIAFCLEEENLLGSLAYAEQLKGCDQPIRGALVLECVGYATSIEGSQRVPLGTPIAVPSVGDFLGIVGNQDSAELAGSFERAVNRDVPGLKTVSLMVPGQGEMLPDVRRSDHAAFWQYGFPALMLTDTADFRNPHYHQPTDTIDTLDLDFIDRVAEAVAAGAMALAGPQ